MSKKPIAVVLVSGGMDSAVVLAHVVSEGYDAHAISFDYGQRHRIELELAKVVASKEKAVLHQVIKLDNSAFQGSALTDDISVPKDRPLNIEEIPVTYVPARNLVFLSIASAYAESIEAADIFIGINAVDYSGYPDCRPDFIEAFERAVNLGTRTGIEQDRPSIRVHCPLVDLSKAQIVARGIELGVDFGATLSCYAPEPAAKGCTPCGHCDACRLRAAGFAEAGVEDFGLAVLGA